MDVYNNVQELLTPPYPKILWRRIGRGLVLEKVFYTLLYSRSCLMLIMRKYNLFPDMICITNMYACLYACITYRLQFVTRKTEDLSRWILFRGHFSFSFQLFLIFWDTQLSQAHLRNQSCLVRNQKSRMPSKMRTFPLIEAASLVRYNWEILHFCGSLIEAV